MNKSSPQPPRIIIVYVLLPGRNNGQMLNLQGMVNPNNHPSTKNHNGGEAARILELVRAILGTGAPTATPMMEPMQQRNTSANCFIIFIFLSRN